VCLSVRDHIFGTTRPIFTDFFVHVTYGRGECAVYDWLVNTAMYGCHLQHGYTPLHQAAQLGHVDVISILLTNGASPDRITNVSYSHVCAIYYTTGIL